MPAPAMPAVTARAVTARAAGGVRSWCGVRRRCRRGTAAMVGWRVRRWRRRVVVATVRVVGRVARHEPSRNGARWLLRNGVLYIATGAWVLARRGWEARTNARYERLLRAAEAAGDYERLTDWEQRAEQARERRHRRRMDWITAPLDVARTAAVMTLIGVGFLLLLGGMLAVAHRDPAWLLTPLQKVVDGIAWAVWLLGPGVAAGHGGAAVAAAGGVVAARAPPRPGAALGRPRRGAGAPDGDRHPGWGRGRAGPPGHPGDEPGGQGRLAGGVRHPAGAGQRARLPDHLLAADGRDPGDGRRQARCAGPQPGPRPAGGVAVRRRARRVCRSVGGRPGLHRAPGPAIPAAARGHRGRVRRGPARGVAARRRDRPGAAGGERGVRWGDGAGQVQRRPGRDGRRRAGPAGRAVGVRVRQQRRLRRLPTPADPLPPRRRRADHPGRGRGTARPVRGSRSPGGPAGRAGSEEGHPAVGRAVSGSAAVGGAVLRVP